MVTQSLKASIEPLTQEQTNALPVYEWDVAHIGDAAPPFTYSVTEQSIAEYCAAVRSDNPLYLDARRAASAASGEPLPTLRKLESQAAIDRYAELTRVRPRHSPSLHSDSDFAKRRIFGGTVNMGVASARVFA